MMRSARLFSVAAILASLGAACGGGDDEGGTPDGASSRDAGRDSATSDSAASDADRPVDGVTSDRGTIVDGSLDIGRADSVGDGAGDTRDVVSDDRRDADGANVADSSDGSLDGPTDRNVDSDAEDAPIDRGSDQDAGSIGPCPAPFPDEKSGVILQAFYWEPPAGTVSWWKMLEGKACDFRKSGITAIWIPPPTKGSSSADMGYGVFDRYDLGQFNQKGSTATRWGTRAELESMVAAMHGAGIRVYVDMVLNHMMGGTNATFTSNGNTYTAPTTFDHSARLNVDPSHAYVWDYTKFSACQVCMSANNCTFQPWMNPQWDFDKSYTSDPNSGTYGTLGMYDALNGCEIRFTVKSNQDELIEWGKWLTDTLKIDGYRIDAAKHIHPPFLSRWISEVKGTSRFAVTEFYDGNPAHLAQVIDLYAKQSHLFDFALHFLLVRMGAGNGSFDMRNLRFGATDDGSRFLEQHGEHAVTFVDNHDTDRNTSTRVVNFKMLAYAYILTRSAGYPTIFYKDYFDGMLAAAIDKVIAARNAHGFGATYDSNESDADFYVSGRVGDAAHKGMLVFLNDGGGTSKKLTSSPFANQPMKDETGASTATVTTDAQGGATFPVPARGHAIWAPQ
ncbi:MAG: alpha-amylase domain-containing protein [Polyangiaceae bacterium]